MPKTQSYRKYSVMKVLEEHDRTASKYKNEVDLSRTYLNYGFGITDHVELRDAIFDRVHEIIKDRGKLRNAETMSYMSEWEVNYPKEFCTKVERTDPKAKRRYTPPKEDLSDYYFKKVDERGRTYWQPAYFRPNDYNHCREFFQAVYDMTVERYGAENVLGGFVHLDETSPHIAINFVPEGRTAKGNKPTVSEKACLPKKELKAYQQNLDDLCFEMYGVHNLILNGRTKGNLSTEEIKERQSQEEEITQWAIRLQDREQENADWLADLERRERELDEKEKDLKRREKAVRKEWLSIQESRKSAIYKRDVLRALSTNGQLSLDISKKIEWKKVNYHNVPTVKNSLSKAEKILQEQISLVEGMNPTVTDDGFYHPGQRV